jgi:hypothetical protein
MARPGREPCYKLTMPDDLPRIGWREWISLPALGIDRIAAKVDTGAKTSVLHARDVIELDSGWIEFTAPLLRTQRNLGEWEKGGVRRVRAELVDRRRVRSSNGGDELRWVIRTPLVLRDTEVFCEFSLTTRARLKFPVLLGRSALSGRFLVDAALPRAPHELDTP